MSQEIIEPWPYRQEDPDIKLRSLEFAETSITSTEEELDSAINALKASTRNIERQTKILDAQNSYLNQLTSSDDAARTRKASHVHYVHQKEAAEVQHIKFANDQLSDALRLDLQIQRDNVAKDLKSVHAIVTELLHADDRALADLEEISSAARPKVALDVNAAQSRGRKLMAALRHFHAEALKDRLDRSYLESLSHDGGINSAEAAKTSNAAIEAVQDDLGSLYAEIDDVITMVVSQEHGSALNSSIQEFRRIERQEKQSLNEQVFTKLGSLTDSLDDLSGRLEALQAQRLALHNLTSPSERLKSDLGAHPNASAMPPRTESTDGIPGVTRLLHGLHIATDLADMKPDAILAQVDNLTATSERQCRENIATIVHLSEEAATRRLGALEGVSDALAAGDKHDQDVRILEESIARARAEMERAAASDRK